MASALGPGPPISSYSHRFELLRTQNPRPRTRRLGDPQALARLVVAAIPILANHRGAGPPIARTAQPANTVVGHASPIRADHALPFAQGSVVANAILARRDRARIAGRAVAIAEAFHRGAIAAQARLSRAASGIVAAIARRASHSAGAIVTANRAIVAIMLMAKTRFTTDITGARLDRAVGQTATRARATRNADIALGSGAAAQLTGATAEIAIRPRAELIHRAAKIFAIAMPGAAAGSTTFGIVGIGRIEMRMTTMIATDFATIGHGLIARNIAATVFGRAGPAANLVLATLLRFRIETPAIGRDQRRHANTAVASLSRGLIRREHIAGNGGLARFLQRNSRVGRTWHGDRRSQCLIGNGSGNSNRRSHTEHSAKEPTTTLARGHSSCQSVKGVLIHFGRPNPILRNAARYRHTGRATLPVSPRT